MDAPGDHFLPGPALAGDQYGGVGPRDPIGDLQNPLHWRGGPHDLPLHAFGPDPQGSHLRLQAAPVERPFHGKEELISVKRLPDEVVCSAFIASTAISTLPNAVMTRTGIRAPVS